MHDDDEMRNEAQLLAVIDDILVRRGYRPVVVGDIDADDPNSDTLIGWKKIAARGVRVHIWRNWNKEQQDRPLMLDPYWKSTWSITVEEYRSFESGRDFKDWYPLSPDRSHDNCLSLLEAVEQVDVVACEALAQRAGFQHWRQGQATGWQKTFGNMIAVVFYGYESFADKGNCYGDPCHAFWNVTFKQDGGTVPQFPWFNEEWEADPGEGELFLSDAFSVAMEIATR